MKNQYKIALLFPLLTTVIVMATVMAFFFPEDAGYWSLVPVSIGIAASLILTCFLINPIVSPANVPYKEHPLYHQTAYVFAETFQLEFLFCIHTLRQMWLLKRISGVVILLFGLIIWSHEHSFTPLFATFVATGYMLGFTNIPLPSYRPNTHTSEQAT